MRVLHFAQLLYGVSDNIGYVMRLADLNEIPDLRWLLRIAGLHQPNDYKYKFSSDIKVIPQRMSALTGVAPKKINQMLYRHEQGRTRNWIGNLTVFGQPVLYHFVQREKPKICPACLVENNYCRKIWELAFITVCPHHHCLLIDHCPRCRRKINWTRPKINVCSCEFDWRKSEVTMVPSAEQRLTKYLFQNFGLPFQDDQVSFTPPLNKLGMTDLLNLLFFVAAHYDQIPNHTGIGIAKYSDNETIHRLLFQALEVFDDWMSGFYDFIREWRKQDKKYFINCKQLYLSKIALLRRYSQYELLNQILHNIFYEEQFAFLHEAFAKFLETQADDSSEITSLADYFSD